MHALSGVQILLHQHLQYRLFLIVRTGNPPNATIFVLSSIADHKINRIDELSPWSYLEVE
jgi:hypothetical protein